MARTRVGRALTASVAVVVVLATVGCGGSTEEQADAPATTATTAGTAGGGSAQGEGTWTRDDYLAAAVEAVADDPSLTAEQARCFFSHNLDAVGIEALVEAGVSPEELAETGDFDPFLSEDERQATFVDVMVDCFDVTEMLASESGGLLSDEDIACLREQVDERWLAEIVNALQLPDGYERRPEAAEAYDQLAEACPAVAAALTPIG